MLVSALVLSGPIPHATAAPAAACVEGFETVEATTPLHPLSVLTRDRSSALVAGTASTAPRVWSARIARYDAGTWRNVLTRTYEGMETSLMAIDGNATKGRHAVGIKLGARRVLPYSMRQRNDGNWREAWVPRAGAFSVFLTDVAVRSKTATWSAGYRLGSAGTQMPHVVRWDGKRWTDVSPSLAAGERGLLSAVSATNSGGNWIAGSVTKSRVERPYIARRDGGKWKRMPLPLVGPGAIADIVVTAKTVGWAVGYRMDSGIARPLVLRWDGKRWKRVGVPELPEETLLLGVDYDAGAAVLVGATWDPAGWRMRPITVRREAGGWKVRELKGFGTGAVMRDLDGHKPEHGFLVAHSTFPTVGALVRSCEGTGVSVAARKSVRQHRRTELEADHDHSWHPAETVPAPRVGLAAAPKLKTSPASTAPVTIVDVAGRAGLPTKGYTYGAVIRDFDGDGEKDIFLGRHFGPAALYLNDGGSFDKAPVAFTSGDRHGCTATDVDGSGLPDLYCTFGAGRGHGISAHELWLDPGGKNPRRARDAGGARELLGRGRYAEVIDFDDDGHKDLVVGSQPNRSDGLPSLNRVYRWTGPGRFELVRDSGLPAAIGVRSMDTADFDRDGRMDLLLVSEDPKARGATSSVRLFRNTRDGFVGVHGSRGIKSIGEVDAELAGLDGDDRFDLIQLSKDRIRVSLQRKGGFVRVYERTLPKGRALAVGDADGDGDTDIYILRRKTDGVRDLILFNEGDGRSYTAIAAPTRPGGLNDTVHAIDHDGNGMTDFLVLDGRSSTKGPIHLIAFYPR